MDGVDARRSCVADVGGDDGDSQAGRDVWVSLVKLDHYLACVTCVEGGGVEQVVLREGGCGVEGTEKVMMW